MTRDDGVAPLIAMMVEQPFNGGDKVFHLEWLALKRVEFGVRNPLPIRGHHRRGDGHDGDSSSGLIGSQPPERLDPVHPGEPNFKTNGASPPPRDFELSGYGTVYLFRPLTPAAHAWVEEHLPPDATWWCGAVVVEHRCIDPIVGGAIGAGLMVR